MMTDIQKALLEAIRASRRAALLGLTIPRYLREIIVTENSDGTFAVSIAKFGFGYKYRGPRITPRPADTEGIKNALNNNLPDSLIVREVSDAVKEIYIILEVHNGYLK